MSASPATADGEPTGTAESGPGRARPAAGAKAVYRVVSVTVRGSKAAAIARLLGVTPAGTASRSGRDEQ